MSSSTAHLLVVCLFSSLDVIILFCQVLGDEQDTFSFSFEGTDNVPEILNSVWCFLDTEGWTRGGSFLVSLVIGFSRRKAVRLLLSFSFVSVLPHSSLLSCVPGKKGDT